MASPNRMERGEGADPLSHNDPWGNFRAGSCGGTEIHVPSTPDGSAHSAGSKGKGFSQPIFATTYHDVTNAQVPSPAGVGFGPGKGKGNVGTTFPTAVYAPQQPTQVFVPEGFANACQQGAMYQGSVPGVTMWGQKGSGADMFGGMGFGKGSCGMSPGPCSGCVGVGNVHSDDQNLSNEELRNMVSMLYTQVQSLQNLLQSQNTRVSQRPPGLDDEPTWFGQQFGEPRVTNVQGGREQTSDKHLDVFSKAEKWLPNFPVPKTSQWVSRETEITGFHEFLNDLRAWAALASAALASEISQAARWPQEIVMSQLRPEQQTRSTRLLSILKSCFSGHARSENLIRAFQEGIGSWGAVDKSYSDNGFELLRTLCREYSLRSRAEALSLRAELVNRSFRPSEKETSNTTLISDTIRKIDVAVSRFQKLVRTLPSGTETVGVDFSDADQLLLLLRNLPKGCTEFILLHAEHESYPSARQAAYRYERQRRLFSEFGMDHHHGKGVHAVHGDTEVFDMTCGDELDETLEVNQVSKGKGSSNRCSKCGSKRHDTNSCSVDLQKLKCFKCGQSGHISANCRNKGKADGSSSVSKGDSKGSKGKGKPGKGSGGSGKKGKMFEVSQDAEQSAEAPDDESWWAWPESTEETPASEGANAVNSVLLAGLFPQVWGVSHEGEREFWGDSHELEVFELGSSVGEQSDHDSFVGDFGGNEVLEERERRSEREVSEWNAQDGFADSWKRWSRAPIWKAAFGVCVGHLVTSMWVDGGHVKGWLNHVFRMLIVFLLVICIGSFGVCSTQHMSGFLFATTAKVDESTYWLMDSGAAASIVNVETLKGYQHTPVQPCRVGFCAANDTPVYVQGQCQLTGFVRVRSLETQKVSIRKLQFSVIVGGAKHNILSTNQCVKHGWFFSFEDKLQIFGHRNERIVVTDVCSWGNCPWVVIASSVDEFSNLPETSNIMSPIRVVSMEGDDSQELLNHRLHGHNPFHPKCLHCQKAKGVTRHRRKGNADLKTELQADFMFINREGETVERAGQGTLKCLALKEVSSGSIGAILMEGNVAKERSKLIHWLHEFGLSSEHSSILLTTDSEAAVSAFVTGASREFTFLVSKAGPQSHEAVGHGERAVRSIKESILTVKSDLVEHGVALRVTVDSLSDLLEYSCLSYNLFARVHGGERSPKELVCGRRLPEQHHSLFLSKVLAETSEAVQSRFPGSSRFVGACFVKPHWGSQASVVIGEIVHEGSTHVVRFVAKSIKAVLPLQFDPRLYTELMSLEISGPEEQLDGQGVALPSPSLRCPASGPPVEWLRLHGPSPQCGACRQLKTSGIRKSHNHSRSCRDRYEQWLRSLGRESSRIEGDKVLDSSGRRVRFESEPPVEPPVEGSDQKGEEDSLGDYSPSVAPETAAIVVEEREDFVEEQFPKTRGCPSCDTGMNCPGCRHSAACKRRREEFDKRMQLKRTSVETGLNDEGEIGRKGEVQFSDLPSPDDDHMVEDAEEDLRPLPGQAPRPLQEPASEGGGGDDVVLSDPPRMSASDDSQLTEKDVTEEDQRLTSRSVKRPAGISVEDLEKEINEHNDKVARSESALWYWDFLQFMHVFTEAPSFHQTMLMVESVRFSSGVVKWEDVSLGGSVVRVWCPESAVDDSNGDLLNGELTFKGMISEIENLEACQAGDLMPQSRFEKFSEDMKKKGETLRVISSRWVTVAKGEGVRSRIVIKDFSTGSASGGTARSLGISSPTPSTDAMMMVLSIASHFDWTLAAMDVAHAFMNTPRVKRDVAIKMPLSCSATTGEPTYLWLRKVLNGLRSASLEWLQFLRDQILRPSGLHADKGEPCLFSGTLKSGGRAICLTYVDDMLVAVEKAEDIEYLKKIFEAKVTVKQTGIVTASTMSGGKLTFLGREVTRIKGDKTLRVSVPFSYLQRTFEDYGLKDSNRRLASPDLSVLEKDGEPLTGEAYAKFRSALGRVSWLAQTRMDIRLFIALISTQQSKPTQTTESALRCLLRFLKQDGDVVLLMPSPDLDFGDRKHDPPKIVCYSDASHAPFRTTGRRGVSGGVLSLLGSCVKCYARHQTSVSLSSCESELNGIQMMAQETVVFARLVCRVFNSFQTGSDPTLLDKVVSELNTDSESGIKVLRGMDLQRRVRHIEVKVEWLKEKIHQEDLVICYKSGKSLVADLLTKCLRTELFKAHRTTMGFAESTGADVAIMHVWSRRNSLVVVEVCCGENSMIQSVCGRKKIPYFGVCERMESRTVFDGLVQWLKKLRSRDRLWIHIHVSTPCTTGSPLRHFTTNLPNENDFVWDKIIQCSDHYMSLGNSSSFELPLHNDIWGRWKTKQLLDKQKHIYAVNVWLCATGLIGRAGDPIGKQMKFTSNVEKLTKHLEHKFGTCRCKKHAALDTVDWKSTETYNKRLAEEFVNGLEKTICEV